jgi:hypothetical protein
MYLVILLYPQNSVEVTLTSLISTDEYFDWDSWVSENYGENIHYMISDYINISI